MQVGGYILGPALGRGATATVYEATDPTTGASVAIKLYSSTRSLKPAARRRFELELQTLSRLEHPGIVKLEQAGEQDGMLYVVMELVRGETLQARLDREGPLSEREARRVVQALSAAVDYVHRCDVLHRDLKPENVLLSPRGPLLTDFGLARDLEDDSDRLTQTGALLGTPGYLSPEQASGRRERIGKPVDVYGLGGILYACLTGVPPVRGESMPEVISATVQGQVTPLRELRPDADPRLERLCRACLALEPSERPSAEDLARQLANPELVASAPGLPWRWIVGACLAALALGLGGALQRGPQEPPPERVAAYEALVRESDRAARHQAARRLIEDYPRSGLGYLFLAQTEAHTQGGSLAQAKRLIERSLALDPDNVEAWLFAASLYASLHDDPARFEALDRAVTLSPKAGLQMRAAHREGAGLLEDAERDLRAWLELAPESHLAWSQLARLLGRRERWPEAAEAFSRAIERAPEAALPQYFRERSRARQKAKQYEGALEDIERCAALAGSWNLGLRASQAELLVGAKRYPEAAAAYREVLQTIPHQVQWLFVLSQLEAALGNPEESARLLQQAHEHCQDPGGMDPRLVEQVEEAWKAQRR